MKICQEPSHRKSLPPGRNAEPPKGIQGSGRTVIDGTHQTSEGFRGSGSSWRGLILPGNTSWYLQGNHMQCRGYKHLPVSPGRPQAPPAWTPTELTRDPSSTACIVPTAVTSPIQQRKVGNAQVTGPRGQRHHNAGRSIYRLLSCDYL